MDEVYIKGVIELELLFVEHLIPPKVINEQPHIPSSDLWCLGILIYELCSGVQPFTAKTNSEIFNNIKNCKMKKYPDYFSKEVKDLIGKLVK